MSSLFHQMMEVYLDPYTPIQIIILRSLAPPQLRSMTVYCKIMCACAICNTSKYFQSSLNAWHRGKLKIMKDEADNSSRRKKDELTQAYTSYADYAFPNDETCYPRCENAADSVLCTPARHEFKYPNWKCLLQKFTEFTYIALSGAERDSSNRAPMIMFNTYLTQLTCSHHGILIREKL